MSKLWCTFIMCKCGSANDIDFKFCKMCGLSREGLHDDFKEQEERGKLIENIDKRIHNLDNLLDSATYSKQKCFLKAELQNFLYTLDPLTNLSNATPENIRKFLIFKEKGGKTQIHEVDCPFRGQHGLKQCQCPSTLAVKSVDSLLGKIRAIFRDSGRSGDWNPMLLTGNPATSHILKRHLKAVGLEQKNAGISAKQATPLLFDKLGKLCRYLSYKVTVEKEETSKFLFARDLSYFSLLSHSGNRAGDLGLLTTNMIFELPDMNGLFISQTAGKVNTIDNPNNFTILPSEDGDICPVKHLKNYFRVASASNIDLNEGYIFRTRDKKSQDIIDQPVSSSCMSDRLKTHLTAINLYDGETSHSSRRGCAITLRMLGVSDPDINKHIGWNSMGMINHYANVGKLISHTGPASVLSKAASNLGQGTSHFDKVSKSYLTLNNLKKFCY